MPHLYRFCLTWQDTHPAKPHRARARELFTNRASLVRLGVTSSQWKEPSLASAGCRINYCWSSYPGVKTSHFKAFCRDPRLPFLGSQLWPKFVYRGLLRFGTSCWMQSKQALGYPGNCLWLNMCFSYEKTHRPNLQLPLITHADKFIRSQCSFELWQGIFHVPCSFCGEKQTFPFDLFICSLSGLPCSGHFG